MPFTFCATWRLHLQLWQKVVHVRARSIISFGRVLHKRKFQCLIRNSSADFYAPTSRPKYFYGAWILSKSVESTCKACFWMMPLADLCENLRRVCVEAAFRAFQKGSLSLISWKASFDSSIEMNGCWAEMVWRHGRAHWRICEECSAPHGGEGKPGEASRHAENCCAFELCQRASEGRGQVNWCSEM